MVQTPTSKIVDTWSEMNQWIEANSFLSNDLEIFNSQVLFLLVPMDQDRLWSNFMALSIREFPDIPIWAIIGPSNGGYCNWSLDVGGFGDFGAGFRFEGIFCGLSQVDLQCTGVSPWLGWRRLWRKQTRDTLCPKNKGDPKIVIDNWYIWYPQKSQNSISYISCQYVFRSYWLMRKILRAQHWDISGGSFTEVPRWPIKPIHRWWPRIRRGPQCWCSMHLGRQLRKHYRIWVWINTY